MAVLSAEPVVRLGVAVLAALSAQARTVADPGAEPLEVPAPEAAPSTEPLTYASPTEGMNTVVQQPTDDPELAVDATDPQPPTTVSEELAQIRPGSLLKRYFDDLAKETNLRIGVAHTMLFQQATGGAGDRTAAGGDLDLYAKWTAIGAGTKDTGVLAFATEYRYQIGNQPPSELGGQIGTLVPTTNSFGERVFTVKEAYWDQRFLGDRLRVVAGRVDPENLFGGHRLQSSSTFFLNKMFSGNPSVAYPGSGLTFGAQVKPVPWLYVSGGINDANGVTTEMNIDGFFKDGEFLSFGEFGLTPTIEGMGVGRYRLALWHIDAREHAGKPSDQGVVLSMDQDVGERATVFFRYAYADAQITNIRNAVQMGAGVKAVFFSDDLLGAAIGWAEPRNDDLRSEKVFEVFHRFQVTEVVQATVGMQIIIDPSNAPDEHAIGVFSARLRVAF